MSEYEIMSIRGDSHRIMNLRGGRRALLGKCARAIIALSLGAVGALVSFADAETFTTDRTISETDLSYENQDIIIEGATVTIDGYHAFNSLTIRKNTLNRPGTLNHSAATEGLALYVARNVFIEGPTGTTGSKINLDGRGSKGSLGPGAGFSFMSSGGGGGYGGAGGDASDANQATQEGGLGGECYGFQPDELFFPTKLGSGGGNRWNGTNRVEESGGTGGGAILLFVGGTLTLNGVITTNGGNGQACGSGCPSAGGGSGGSIQVQCGLLSGTGIISANGGSGGNSSEGGGGGGGRIALHYITSTFAGSRMAIGGTGNQRGGAGTIFEMGEADLRGKLLVDGGHADNPETTEFSARVILDVDMTIRNRARVGPSHSQTDFSLTVMGNMTVEQTGEVYAIGRGMTGSQGQGAGQSVENGSGGGGGYGGAGGAGSPTNSGGNGGGPYGSSELPTDLGSGGGDRWTDGHPVPNTGGSGGGTIHLTVSGMLALNGAINANGSNGQACGSGCPSAGGGSGGSILVQCGLLSGTGVISANGGHGGNSSEGGGGGGGRIAVHACYQLLPMANITVNGGSGFQPGQPGSTMIEADGHLDLGEHSMLTVCLIGPGGGITSDMCECLDLQADGDVDLQDFAILQRVFTAD